MEASIGRARALDLLLNRENPRHEPKRNQPEIIEYLLRDEQVYNLARHISKNGLSPLELTGVFPDNDGNLIVAEGNRRVCALQLLNDPRKAPLDQRKRFAKLAAAKNFPESILVSNFDDYEQARPWLQVTHDGEQDGVGRRTWRAEQKARFTRRASTQNLSVRLMDYSISAGLLTASEKEQIKLTTLTRYLENPQVRSAMGIATTSTNPNVQIELPDQTFVQVLGRFIDDARQGTLHSRSTSKDWRAYARDIEVEFDTRKGRTRARPLDDITIPGTPPKTPAKPRLKRVSTDKIAASEAVVNELNSLKSAKLSSIYGSLTSLSLGDHPALLTAGAWIFLESLSALHGRAGASFESYIQGQVNKWGIARDPKREINLSLRYISEHGNAEKHSAKFTSIDAGNLRTHFHVLDDVIARLLRECPR